MKKYLSIFVLMLLGLALPAEAQFSRIIQIRLVDNDNDPAAVYNGPFTIKMGADCDDWSVTGTVATLNCAGSGVVPGGNAGEVQFNDAGSFGGVTGLTANEADCDGFGDPCMLFASVPSAFTYILSGTDANATAGNGFFVYPDGNGGLRLESTDDAVTYGALGISPTGSSLNSGIYGTVISSSNKAMTVSRLAFGPSASLAETTDFAISAGWGTTASVSDAGGSDNNFLVVVTSGGTGQGANPTITYTYADGDFDAGSSNTPAYVCSQTGGDDIISDVTITRGQTSVILTWHGTPTDTKLYEISCIGIQRN